MRHATIAAMLALSAGFLLLPALHYSMDTPVGLVQANINLSDKFDSLEYMEFWYKKTFIYTDPQRQEMLWFYRFRPFLDIWNGLIWRYFGDSSAHYANRWLFIFGTAAFLIAAFTRITRQSGAQTPYQVIPVAVLAYIWLFFPNASLMLIDTAELYTVFFLSVCNYAFALMLTRRGATPHALFALGFVGLLFSKEPNLVLAPWLLACYLAIAQINGRGFMALMVAFALSAVSLNVLSRISLILELATKRGDFFVSDRPLADRFPDGALTIIKGLLQFDTSLVVAATLVCFLLVPIVVAVTRIARRKFDGELAFIVILVGEFASLFAALCAQFKVIHRYWVVLIPLLASLIAFSAKYLLDYAERNKLTAVHTATGLTVVLALFVSINYYNFLYQFCTYHSARIVDATLVERAAALLNDGEYVAVDASDFGGPAGEQYKSLLNTYRDKRYWPGSTDNDGIHDAPPSDPDKPYYVLDLAGNGLPSNIQAATLHVRLAGRADYRVLDYAARLSGFLQGRASPHATISLHPMPGPLLLGEYHMAIYAIVP